MKYWWSALLLVLGGPAVAAELRSIDMQFEDGFYTMESEVWLDAGIEPVYDVFSNWGIATRFSGAIAESRDLPPDEFGRPGFYIVNRGCALFFCKSVTRQGWVERDSPGLLRAIADPEHSDFEVSNETWEFSEDDGGTVVTYRLYMKPAFWVPPLIGPYVIMRRLRDKAEPALVRIESIAQDYSETGYFASD